MWTARTRTRVRPNSDNVARLARTYLEAGEITKSAETLAKGLDQFPALSDLEDVAHFVAQLQLRQQESNLRDVLDQTRQAYHELARAHVAVGDLKSATEVIWAGLQRFPDSAPLYRELGEIHLGLFLEDYLPRDGTLAAENLERAAQLDETDILSHRYLVGLFMRVGSYDYAAQHLRRLLEKMSSAESDYAFLESMLVRCQHHVESDPATDLGRNLESVHEKHAVVEDIGDWGRPAAPALRRRDVSLLEVVPSLLQKAVTGFLAQSKAGGAVLVTRTSEMLLGRMPFPGEVEALPALVRALSQTTSDSVHRMELGHSRRTLMQLSGGLLGSVRLRNAEVIFLFGPGFSAKSVNATLTHFTDWLARTIGENGEGHSDAAEPECRD